MRVKALEEYFNHETRLFKIFTPEQHYEKNVGTLDVVNSGP